jgi:TonB family protein
MGAPVAPWSGAGDPTPPVLWLRVGTDGAVRDVRVVTPSSETRFTEAATSAARALTFSPALKDGKPVTAWTQLAITKE